MNKKPPFAKSDADPSSVKDEISGSTSANDTQKDSSDDSPNSGGLIVKANVNSPLPVLFVTLLVLLGAFMLWPKRLSLVITGYPRDQTLHEKGTDVLPPFSPPKRSTDQVLLPLQGETRSDDSSTFLGEQVPSSTLTSASLETSPIPDRVERTAVSVQNVDEERIRIASVERKVNSILDETKALAHAARGRYGGNWLRNLVESLQKQVAAQQFSLMSHSTVSRITFEAVSMKAVCIYAKAGIKLEDEIFRFKVALLPLVGGTTKLADIVRLYTYIPVVTLENPKECCDPPYDQEERWLVELGEMEAEERAALESRRPEEQLVKRLLRHLSERDIKRKLTPIIVSLNAALKSYSEAITTATSLLLTSQKEFLWLDKNILSVCRALQDVLELSISLRREEIAIYTKIARGQWSYLLSERSRVHELCLRREVAFDFFVYRSLEIPLPADLVSLLAIKLPFRDQQRPFLIDRLEAVIKWGSELMKEMDKDATVASLASVFRFNFAGILTRPFSVTWMMRGYRERELILKTNMKILKKEKLKYHFADAVQEMAQRVRRPLKSCPTEWLPLPVEVVTGGMPLKLREQQCAANRLMDILQLESEMEDAKAALMDSQNERIRKHANQVELDSKVRGIRKADMVKTRVERAKTAELAEQKHNRT